jgi:hypothetical protein
MVILFYDFTHTLDQGRGGEGWGMERHNDNIERMQYRVRRGRGEWGGTENYY